MLANYDYIDMKWIGLKQNVRLKYPNIHKEVMFEC